MGRIEYGKCGRRYTLSLYEWLSRDQGGLEVEIAPCGHPTSKGQCDWQENDGTSHQWCGAEVLHHEATTTGDDHD